MIGVLQLQHYYSSSLLSQGVLSKMKSLRITKYDEAPDLVKLIGKSNMLKEGCSTSSAGEVFNCYTSERLTATAVT